MGSGKKFKISVIEGVGLAIVVSSFPHRISINLLIGIINIYIGIGKGYDE